MTTVNFSNYRYNNANIQAQWFYLKILSVSQIYILTEVFFKSSFMDWFLLNLCLIYNCVHVLNNSRTCTLSLYILIVEAVRNVRLVSISWGRRSEGNYFGDRIGVDSTCTLPLLYDLVVLWTCTNHTRTMRTVYMHVVLYDSYGWCYYYSVWCLPAS